jgi:hypothetical protein
MDRTNAERQRRYIARLKAAAQPSVTNAVPKAAVTKSDAGRDRGAVTKLLERLEEVEEELDRARAELRDLRKIGLGFNRNLLHNEPFQQELKKHIEGLVAEGRKNMATMSPPSVAILTHKLERLLVDHGIWTGSKRRKTDPGWRDA